MFIGFISGYEVSGGLTSSGITFKIKDATNSIYTYAEGIFDVLGLNLCFFNYTDSNFIKLIGASYHCYTNIIDNSIAGMPSFTFLEYLECKNGAGLFYNLESNNNFHSTLYETSLTFIKQNSYVAVANATFGNDSVTLIIVFKEFTDDGAHYVIAGMSDSPLNNTRYLGSMSILDYKLITYINTRASSDFIELGFLNSSFDIDFDIGNIDPSVNISGNWEGTLYTMIDGKVVDNGSMVRKSISQIDNVFACVEEITIDNVTTTYTWIRS